MTAVTFARYIQAAIGNNNAKNEANWTAKQ